MATNNLDQIATNLEQLSRDDLEKLVVIIKKILCPNDIDHKTSLGDLRENMFTISLVCPHCSSTHVIKFGHSHKNQRYRCKDCRKTFGDYTLYRRFAKAGIPRGGSTSPSAH
jgi:hypothetical protein